MSAGRDVDLSSADARAVLEVLRRYVSPPTARSVFELALRRAGLDAERLSRADLPRVITHMRAGLGLFARDPAQLAGCLAQLEKLAGTAAPFGAPDDAGAGGPAATGVGAAGVGASSASASAGASSASAGAGVGDERGRTAATTIAVRSEAEVLTSRSEARTLAQRVGFSEVGRTKLATAVSELVRNIVRYAGSGTLELRVIEQPVRGIEVVARDRGPGIANLDEVLNGTYRSQHGMGLGLRGVRRLSQHFDIQTAPGRGTTVLFRMETE